jgi:putative acetyltransferase
MELRRYRPSDCRELTELFFHTVHTVNAKDYTEEQLNVWATGEVDFEKWNQSLQEHFSMVAVDQERIVGFGDIDDTGYLDRLYVHADYQRQGIATAICNQLEQAVSGDMITHASITARPFFEARGYRVVKEQQVERQGIFLTNYIMKKKRKNQLMKILYGTTNDGKLEAMKTAVKGLDVELIGLNEAERRIPSIQESGSTLLDNAEIKARTYYEAFHIPVFSCDSGLYFDEVKEEDQPGVHVRRVQDKELSDDEMIEYYGALAKKYGGKITGRYRNAIYLILDENHHYSSMDLSIATEPFILVEKPHSKRVKGFPLDSLSIDIESGKYYYDLEDKDVSTSVDDGVRKFFAMALSKRKESLETILCHSEENTVVE